jgi:hypothetical protein
MNEDKNMSVPNNPLFSGRWFREYWTIQPTLVSSFILFLYGGYKIISACLSHQLDYQVIRFTGLEFYAVGLAIGSLKDWAKKEQPKRYPTIWWTSLLTLSAGLFIDLLSYLREEFPDLTIQFTFYP